MSRIIKTVDLVKDLFYDLYRFLKGGEPTPEALTSLAEVLSDREDLSRDRWISEIRSKSTVSDEAAIFAYEFFVDMGIPIGRVRLGDRLKDDLHIRETLPDDWDYDLQQAFRERFGKRIVFRRGSPWVTVSDILALLHETIGGRRNELP